jgi:hypothetical protein
MDVLFMLLLALLVGVLIGRVWAYQRACATADQPDAAAPDVVASLSTVWGPRALLRTGGVGEER